MATRTFKVEITVDGPDETFQEESAQDFASNVASSLLDAWGYPLGYTVHVVVLGVAGYAREVSE